MAKKFRVINLNSGIFGKKPNHQDVEGGELSVNTNPDAPFIAFKTDDDEFATTVTKAVFDSEHGIGVPTVENGILTIPIAQGAQGVAGPQGVMGAQGPVGIAGEQGIRGAVGLQGDAGEPGPQGNRGGRGNRGVVGQQGNAGVNGPQGDAGAEGNHHRPQDEERLGRGRRADGLPSRFRRSRPAAPAGEGPRHSR